MAKRHASLLSFCQITHKRQRKSEEKASNDQDQESDDQDVQVVDSPEESDGPYLLLLFTTHGGSSIASIPAILYHI